MNLLESYKGRLSVSEKYYASQHNGAKMSTAKKMTTAMCLNNISKFMNEAFENSVGTQRSDLGAYKKFCLDLTTLTIPNLIINDLFMVQPMSGFSGYATYMQYALGTEKGTVGGLANGAPFKSALATYDYAQSTGDPRTVVIDPFQLGEMTEDRKNYTGQAVVETATDGQTKLTWTPVIPASLEVVDASGAAVSGITVDAEGTITSGTLSAGMKIKYKYDNAYIPANQLPTMVGRMKAISLQAKVRRIAVYYSQLAAFQAKNDYGMDFEAQIAQQAQAELQYEIDSEAVMLIKDNADTAVVWTDLAQGAEATGSNYYSLYAEGLARAIEQAKAKIYKTTQRFMPNWMLVGPDALAALVFVKGFESVSTAVANGPYLAGNYNGMKVFVSPILEKEIILGVNGVDGKTSVGLYAPYMPIVPTQLLGFADGTMSQGFSTMYDMVILNKSLLAKVEIRDAAGAVTGQGALFPTA